MSNSDNIDNYPDYIEHDFVFNITAGFSPERLDVFLTNNIRNATRTKVQKAIDEGYVTINGKIVKSNRKIKPGDRILCKLMKPPPIELVPEQIELDIIFEDEFLMVVNKPPGIVSHPAFGNRHGTLVNGVLYHLGYREAITVESDSDEDTLDGQEIFKSDEIRPGLVNRLDKDTSGIILISKNPDIHYMLAKQFSDRTVSKFYQALVWGKFNENHLVFDSNIGRSTRDRKLFAVVKKGGKEAKTEVFVEETFDYVSFVKIKLWTGRTHQIRVHFSHDNHPLVGDSQYGGTSVRFGGNNSKFKSIIKKILDKSTGQMLHSSNLTFFHPIKKENMTFESSLPENFKTSLNILREYSENGII